MKIVHSGEEAREVDVEVDVDDDVELYTELDKCPSPEFRALQGEEEKRKENKNKKGKKQRSRHRDSGRRCLDQSGFGSRVLA